MLINKRRDETNGSQSGSPPAHRALVCTHFGCSGCSNYYWGRCNRPRLNGLILKEGSWPLGEGDNPRTVAFVFYSGFLADVLAEGRLGSFGCRAISRKECTRYVDKSHERRAGGARMLNARKG